MEGEANWKDHNILSIILSVKMGIQPLVKSLMFVKAVKSAQYFKSEEPMYTKKTKKLLK